MKKIEKFLLGIAALAVGTAGIGFLSQPAKETKAAVTAGTYTYNLVTNFGTYASSWGSSYAAHSVASSVLDSTLPAATIAFASANKQTATIIDRPVTKASNNTFTLSESGFVITKITFTVAQWTTKIPTFDVFEGTTNTTKLLSASTFGLTASGSTLAVGTSGELTLAGTNTTVVSFNQTSANQVGYSSIVVTIAASSITYDPVTSIGLSKTSGTYSVTGGEAVTTTVLPSSANQGVSWTTSNEFVATASSGTIYAVGFGTATITATTIGKDTNGNSLTATFSATVNAFGILDLRDSAGAVQFSGKTVAVTGTVTKVVSGGGVYIQVGSGSTARAVYGYNGATTVSSATVGKLCTIKGAIAPYNGLLELSGALFNSSSTDGETITPWAITDVASTALLGHDSVLISVAPLVLTAIPTLSTSANTTVSVKFGATTTSLYAGKAAVSSADDTTINTLFTKLGTSGTFSFTGILGWYNAPQFNITAASEIATEGTTDADFTAVQNFITNYMHMGDDIADQCFSVYPAAETAFTALTTKQQGILSTSTFADYSAAYKRYVAWGIGYAAGNSASKVQTTDSNSTSIATLGLLGAAILASCGFFFYKKKHA